MDKTKHWDYFNWITFSNVNPLLRRLRTSDKRNVLDPLKGGKIHLPIPRKTRLHYGQRGNKKTNDKLPEFSFVVGWTKKLEVTLVRNVNGQTVPEKGVNLVRSWVIHVFLYLLFPTLLVECWVQKSSEGACSKMDTRNIKTNWHERSKDVMS